MASSGVASAPVVQKAIKASVAAVMGAPTGPAAISLTASADASTTGRAPAPSAEPNAKLQKKGSFSNLLASLGKKKGSSSSLTENDPASSPAQADRWGARING